MPLNVGHIFLKATDDAGRFVSLVEALDRLAINQHVLVADEAIARRLRALPFATVGPTVSTAIMACCLMPDVDVVHVHDDKAGQAGLLLTLTRSMPFVMESPQKRRGPLMRSMLNRAHSVIQSHDPDALVEIYRHAANRVSELPKNSNCG